MRCIHYSIYILLLINSILNLFLEPIHKQKHNHDLFYQKESSFYEDLEDSYSYCNYDTDQHPANDDLHCTHRTHDCNHTQCNHQGK